MNAIDLTGQKFHRLTVISEAERAGNVRQWLCRCDCGNIAVVRGNKLRSGHTKSCGCLQREKAKLNRGGTTHGLAHGKDRKPTRLYRIWLGMKTRCHNPNSDHFEKYMGRGITVCDEWRNDFKAFHDWALSNGYRDDLTIDRIDSNGNYSPENCRWATIVTQNRNRRTAVTLEYLGESHTIAEWAEISGVSSGTLYARYKRGWTPEEIINGKRA